jgi:hypothetical protein
MPPKGRRPVADDDSMEVDPNGLTQSRHNNASPPDQERDKGDSRAIRIREKGKNKEKYKEFAKLILGDTWDGGEMDEATAQRVRRALKLGFVLMAEEEIDLDDDDDRPITLKDFKLVIHCLKEDLKPAKRTWADIAANNNRPPSDQAPTTQTKVIPARRARQLTVRAPNMAEDLKNRDNKAVVAAVNTASPTKRQAIAVTRLPSGDHVITFTEGGREWYADNTTWVKKAFGETAELVGQTYTVMAKYVPREYVRRTAAGQAATIMSKDNNVKISQVRNIQRFDRREDPRTHILLEVTHLEHAQKLCRDGLVWEAQIFNCEPYTPELLPMQCYKCWGWGHMAKHCKAAPRCSRCSATAHEGGETQCPSNSETATKRCPACGGNHTAFDRRCPVRRKQWEIARANYLTRPRTFARAHNPATQFIFKIPEPTDTAAQKEDWVMVGAKRRRPVGNESATDRREIPGQVGRPRDILRAGRTNGATLDTWTTIEDSQLSQNPW